MVPIRNALVTLTVISPVRQSEPKNGACMKTFASLDSA